MDQVDDDLTAAWVVIRRGFVGSAADEQGNE